MVTLKQVKYYTAVFVLLFWVLVTGLLYRRFTLTRRVETPASLVNATERSEDADQVDLVSNEVLFKVKRELRNRIDADPSQNTEISAFNVVNKRYGFKLLKRIIKASELVSADTELSAWYKLTLDTQAQRITAKISRKTGKLQSSNPDLLLLQDIITQVNADSNVEAAEPNYVVESSFIPNDTFYAQEWGAKAINLEAAWDKTTGGSSIIIADVDSGVDRNHEDMRDNMWVNTREIPNNLIDDDHNGFIDDYYGWDWVNNDNDPFDDNGHGTHTAGIMAAVGNNSAGIAGVNWKSKIMSLKFLDSTGSGNVELGARAIQYAADNGAKIISNSWGCKCQSKIVADAIRYAHDKGALVVVAAGNNAGDVLDYTPAASDRALVVGASDQNNNRAPFSNYGEKVEVVAPGVDILSSRLVNTLLCSADQLAGPNYCKLSGTSMATPYVSGLAALMLSVNAQLSNEDLRQIIRTTSIDIGQQGRDQDTGFGLINADTAVIAANLNLKPLTPVLNAPANRTTISGTAVTVSGTIGGPDLAAYSIAAAAGRNANTWRPLVTIASPSGSTLATTIDSTKLTEGPTIFRLTATNTAGKSYQYETFDVTVDNFDAAITSPLAYMPIGQVDIVGTALTKNGLALDHYTLEWGQGAAPTAFATTGIALTGEGRTAITNNLLAQWDTTTLAPDVYTLRLTVTAVNGATSQTNISVALDRDLVNHWPKRVPVLNSSASEVVPIAADLDNDGKKDIVTISNTGRVYAWRKDGSDMPGFPVALNAGDVLRWGANVADLDKDGKPEIVVTTTGGKIYIIRSDGSFYPGWPTPMLVTDQLPNDNTPVLADLDGDGKREIVVIERTAGGLPGGKLHAYRLDGSELSGFPRLLTTADTLQNYGALASADIDHDSRPELAFANKRSLYLFDNAGNLLPGWPYIAPIYNNQIIVFESAPVFGDMLGDGNKEVFALGKVFNCSTCDTLVYGWKKDGTVLPGWPLPAGKLAFATSRLNSPATADIENDGKDELIVATTGLRAYAAAGLNWSEINTLTPANTEPAISDFDGDGKPDMTSIQSAHVGIVDNAGITVWERVFTPDSHFFNAPGIVSDLTGNGQTDLLVVRSLQTTNDGTAYVYLWEAPHTTQLRQDWPMYLHDASHSGNINIPFRSPTITPTPAPTDTPPTVAITYPTNQALVAGAITIRAAANDNIGVTKVEFYLDKQIIATLSNSPYEYTWDTVSVFDGNHSLTAKAYDQAGNVTTSAAVAVVVDNTPPTIEIISPDADSEVSDLVNYQVTAFDTSGITKVDFYVDDALIDTKTTAPYATTWDTLPLAHESIHVLYAQAFDNAGNVETSSAIFVAAIDITPPSVTIVSPPPDSFVVQDSTISLVAQASDVSDIVEVDFIVNDQLLCAVDTPPYKCNWHVPNLTNRNHTIEAWAFDYGGNLNLDQITVTSQTALKTPFCNLFPILCPH